MPKRYYVCPLVDTPKGPRPSVWVDPALTADPDAQCNVKTDTGKDWCVVSVNTTVAIHKELRKPADVTSFPDHPPAKLMSEIPADQKQRIRDRLEAKGVDVVRVVDNAVRYRNLFNRLVKEAMRNSGFDFEKEDF